MRTFTTILYFILSITLTYGQYSIEETYYTFTDSGKKKFQNICLKEYDNSNNLIQQVICRNGRHESETTINKVLTKYSKFKYISNEKKDSLWSSECSESNFNCKDDNYWIPNSLKIFYGDTIRIIDFFISGQDFESMRQNFESSIYKDSIKIVLKNKVKQIFYRDNRNEDYRKIYDENDFGNELIRIPFGVGKVEEREIIKNRNYFKIKNYYEITKGQVKLRATDTFEYADKSNEIIKKIIYTSEADKERYKEDCRETKIYYYDKGFLYRIETYECIRLIAIRHYSKNKSFNKDSIILKAQKLFDGESNIR